MDTSVHAASTRCCALPVGQLMPLLNRKQYRIARAVLECEKRHLLVKSFYPSSASLLNRIGALLRALSEFLTHHPSQHIFKGVLIDVLSESRVHHCLIIAATLLLADDILMLNLLARVDLPTRYLRTALPLFFRQYVRLRDDISWVKG